MHLQPQYHPKLYRSNTPAGFVQPVRIARHDPDDRYGSHGATMTAGFSPGGVVGSRHAAFCKLGWRELCSSDRRHIGNPYRYGGVPIGRCSTKYLPRQAQSISSANSFPHRREGCPDLRYLAGNSAGRHVACHFMYKYVWTNSTTGPIASWPVSSPDGGLEVSFQFTSGSSSWLAKGHMLQLLGL